MLGLGAIGVAVGGVPALSATPEPLWTAVQVVEEDVEMFLAYLDMRVADLKDMAGVQEFAMRWSSGIRIEPKTKE